MNNDLISRSALKKALSEPLFRSTIKDFGEVLEYTHIMNTIDNAPTVSTEDCEGCPYCPNSNSGIPIGVE